MGLYGLQPVFAWSSTLNLSIASQKVSTDGLPVIRPGIRFSSATSISDSRFINIDMKEPCT